MDLQQCLRIITSKEFYSLYQSEMDLQNDMDLQHYDVPQKLLNHTLLERWGVFFCAINKNNQKHIYIKKNMYTEKEINEFKQRKEYLRMTDAMTKSQWAEVANWYSKYVGKTIGCLSCGGDHRAAKYELINWFSQVIWNYENGVYDHIEPKTDVEVYMEAKVEDVSEETTADSGEVTSEKDEEQGEEVYTDFKQEEHKETKKKNKK